MTHKLRYLNGRIDSDYDDLDFLVDTLLDRHPSGVCWIPDLQLSVEIQDLLEVPLDGARLYDSDAEMDADGPELGYPLAVIEAQP